MRDQREVFPGLDSGPNGSEGHYFYALEKRPSANPVLTTVYDITQIGEVYNSVDYCTIFR